MVFIGKLSYSLYIWNLGIVILMNKQMPLLAAAVSVIGVLTYSIENKLRVSKHPYTVPLILVFGLILVAIALIVRLS